ncbi:hypothetical protein DFJ74DRAFT_708847 [Hyaloraphidium curvatum]|nr:hypothetical protein DFJ74DRAFT_708847 [Hyaloraphidium curvatum]
MSAAKPPVDVAALSPEDRAFFERYGRLPPARKDLVNRHLKSDRKYFDSGDYALSKAGKTSDKDVGSQHPSPERIPHTIPARSPNRESLTPEAAAIAEKAGQRHADVAAEEDKQ